MYLDDRDLKLERLKWRSQREQYARQYQQALAQRNAALGQIITAQVAQAEAELALVEEHLERAQLRAPFESLVVSGDLSQSIGGPVERGKVLFEVAPLEVYRIILEVDERDIAEVAVGQEGHLVLPAFPNEPLPLTVTKLTPVSTAREGRNYFRVEARLTQTPRVSDRVWRASVRLPSIAACCCGSGRIRRSIGCVCNCGPGCPERGGTSMSEVLFSSSWYRVAALRPRLRRHAQIHRHHYRGQLWYILQDHASQRVHRFSPAAHGVIGLMDGERTVETLWEVASARLGDDAPTQDEVIQLLTQLHAADVLQCDVPPDVTELLLRYERQRRQTWQRQLMNPFFMHLPLVRSRALSATWLPWVRPFFGVPGAAPVGARGGPGRAARRHALARPHGRRDGSHPGAAQCLPPLVGLPGGEDPA